MTAQINDRVFHRKIHFNIAGINGCGLFQPQAVGIQPEAMSTACWRGFYVQYAIEEDQLFLTQVTIGLPKTDAEAARAGGGPELFGRKAKYNQSEWGWVYNDLRQPFAFSGGLLLGEGFIRQLYVHMGFHPAWKYRNVREVLFEQGRLTEDFDRSDAMEGVRAQLSEKPLEPTAVGEIEKWVEKCFSRDYTR